MTSVPVATLGSSDQTIPLLGFGTAEYPFNDSDVKQSILHAIETGYRHFDTASVYLSEKPLGSAVDEALRLGLIKSRHELFITSKLWITDAHPHLVLPALQKTLGNLEMEYVDLYLIHWPISQKPGEIVLPIEKEQLQPLDFEGVWRGMEECHHLGLAKSIGVSNFACQNLAKLLSTARIPPAVNQVEMNALWQQKRLREYCKEHNILITAYAPLGATGTPWGNSRLLDCDVLKEIAREKGKTVAQVCLRWVYEQGVCLVAKSFRKGRMKENIGIFDWELSPEDLAKIEQLPQQRGTTGEGFTSDQGPYKTTAELWGGDE